MRLQEFFLCVLLIPFAAGASDLVREQRMAAEIEDAIVVGDPVRLKTGEVEFFAIHTPVEGRAVRGGVILLHGRGAHPDWSDVINPLRSELPEFGWETLSIQMPVAARDAPTWIYRELIPEAFPRIRFAVEYFKQRGVTRLVLVGHSLGARMGAEFLGQGAPGEIRGFVAVGLPAKGRAKTLEALKKIRVPLLDLYGSRDIDAVLESVGERAAAAREGGNPDYRQREITGADHFFRGLEERLLAEVRDWMNARP